VLIRLASRFGDVGSLGTFGSLDDLKFDGISFLQRAVTISHYGGVVNKYVWSIITSDETVAFRVIKPLNISLHFLKPPGGASSVSDHDAHRKILHRHGHNFGECTRTKRFVNRVNAAFWKK
jgi:hypothetical protein